MRYPATILLLAALACAAGCDISYPDEEMNPAGSGKTRPLAVVFGPAEAMPGDQVTALVTFYEPGPWFYGDGPESEWKIALDYRIGLYGTDEYEGSYVEPDLVGDIDAAGGSGYGSFGVVFTIPEDILLTSSAQTDVIEDPLILGLLQGILPADGEGPVTRAELDELLASDDVLQRPPEERSRLRRVADLFSCEVRLRGAFHGRTDVEVTRNLTVRWSRHLDTINVNQNPVVRSLTLYVTEAPDVPWNEVDQTEGLSVLNNAWTVVEAHDDWTYWLRCGANVQHYTSPYDPDTLLEEDIGIRWYHQSFADDGSDCPLFVTDDGDPAEMFDLDEVVRLRPPSGGRGSRNILHVVVRDQRWEWDQYSSTPGCELETGSFYFVPPE